MANVFVVALVITALHLRKNYLNKYKSDYSLPILKVLKNAERKYRFWNSEWIFIVVLIMVCNLLVSITFNFVPFSDQWTPVRLTVLAQTIYLPLLGLAFLAEWIFWRKLHKPLWEKSNGIDQRDGELKPSSYSIFLQRMLKINYGSNTENMKSTVRKLTILALMMMIISSVNSQQLNKEGTISISVNLVKIFMGMPNLELEYSISPKVSVYIFNEVNLFSKKLQQKGHPDYVMRLGGRYHFLENTDTRNNLHCGPYSGFTKSKSKNQNHYFLGADVGYKYRFNGQFYVYPRTLITYSPNNSKINPGFEFLLGKVNN